jgi:LPS-assembly protein
VLRSAAAPAAVALLVLGPPARGETSLFAGPPGEEVEVEADRITYAWEAPVIRLEGHVVARRWGGIVRAASGSLDRAHGVLKLEGGVLGVQGRQVFLADAAIVDLNARSAELTKAVLYLKEKPANPDAPRSGANALTLHGGRVRQLAGGRYLAEKVTLTPCDCAGTPDYELLADSAEIDGERAHLRGVDLRFAFGGKLPLFPLSLPLTNRQSGLLAPRPGFGGPTGFTYAQPVFLTLGPSYDLTLTPGWHTGGSHDPGARVIKGPLLGTEFRWAPAPGTAGSLSLDLFDDLDQHDSPGGRGYGGVRGMGRLAHRTESADSVFAVQGLAASDVMSVRDQTAQSIETTFDLFTTDVGFWRASGPLTLGADATLMQDMRIDPAAIDRKLLGGGRGTTFQRLPALFAQLAPVSLGQATFSLEASAVQFTRFGKPDPREVTQGFGQTDRASSLPTPDPQPPYTDGSRAPALRLDLAPRLALDAARTLPVELRVEAGGRVDGWIAEGASDRNRARAYALLGARAAVPLERRYGSALHRIEPALEVRALSRPLQAGGPPFGDLTDHGGPGFLSRPDDSQQGLAAAFNDGISGVPAARRAYDEIDFAAPASGAVEATASLSQSVWTKPGGAPGRILRFDLLQDALLWAGGGKARIGEGSALASVQLGPVGLNGSVRYDWALRQVSAFGASAGMRDARGDEIHASLSVLRGSSSERLRAGIDELFSAARFAAAPTTITGDARAGFSGPLPLGLRLAYEVSYTPGDIPANFANWWHTSSLTLETPCRCAGLQFLARLPFRDGHLLGAPEFHLVINLKSLGSFATF